MKWHYDLITGGEPILRDYVVGNTSDILKGAVVAREGGVDTALNRFCLQNADADVLDCIVGVTNEFYDYSVHYSGLSGTTNAATAAQTGVSNYIKVIINPLAVWLAEWSLHADDDYANTVASATGKVVTVTATTDREGDWCYVTNNGSTTGGAGNLFQIGASTDTTSVTACTSYDDYLAGTNTSDTVIFLNAPWTATAAGGSIDLSAATTVAGTQLKGNPETGAGALVVLQNYIKDKATPMEPLKVERNSGRNYDADTAHLYADAFLMEHMLLGNGGAWPTVA